MSAPVTLEPGEGETTGVTDVDDEDTSLGSDVMMTNIWLRAVFVVLYSVIFVVGLSGNSLVVYVVSRNAAMRTITNIFIANLAVSDIMMCLSSLPGFYQEAGSLSTCSTCLKCVCHLPCRIRHHDVSASGAVYTGRRDAAELAVR